MTLMSCLNLNYLTKDDCKKTKAITLHIANKAFGSLRKFNTI